MKNLEKSQLKIRALKDKLLVATGNASELSYQKLNSNQSFGNELTNRCCHQASAIR